MAQNPQQTLIQDKEKQPTKTGTGFVNLNKYLQANQGNKLGQAVSGNIQAAGQQVQQNVQKQQEDFQNKLAQSRAGIGQTQQNVENVIGKFDEPNQFQGITDQDVQTFEDLRNKKYSGPTGLENTNQLEQQSARALGLGQLAQSRGGRQELLRQTIQAPQYTAAQQRLDELMLSLGGGAQDVRKAGQSIKQVAPDVKKQQQDAKSKAEQTARDYAALQQMAREQLTGKTEDVNAILNQQVADQQIKEQARLKAIEDYKNALRTDQIPLADQLQQQYGLFDPNKHAQLMSAYNTLPGYAGADRMNFGSSVAGSITPGSTPISRGQQATAEQRAAMDALLRLSGGSQEFSEFTPEELVSAGYNINNFADLLPVSGVPWGAEQKLSENYGAMPIKNYRS